MNESLGLEDSYFLYQYDPILKRVEAVPPFDAKTLGSTDECDRRGTAPSRNVTDRCGVQNIVIELGLLLKDALNDGKSSRR
jgi:hypothetical protein